MAIRFLRLAMVFGVLSGCGGAQPAPAEAPGPAPAASPATTASAQTAPASSEPKPPVAVAKADWGTVDGKTVQLYTLTNKNGLKLKVSNYGTIITELHVPDKAGNFADIALGYDSVAEYVKATPYFGATVGRIANRIKNAEFKLEGKQYKLAANNGPHNLHGGKKGWDKVIWDAQTSETAAGPEIRFAYTSPDGEEGFPASTR
jgi:aldose 1-epimerase